MAESLNRRSKLITAGPARAAQITLVSDMPGGEDWTFGVR